MNKKYKYLPVLLMLLFSSCTEDWEQHYGDIEKSVDVKLWDTIKTIDKYSEFTKYLELFHLDTVLQSSNSRTLFIPTNQAFTEYLNTDTTGIEVTMKYHITNNFFMLQEVKNKYRLQTLSEKYALIENNNNIYSIDGIEITEASPLMLNGKFYEINEVVKPKPNLYQYIMWNNPAVRKYIDKQDTIILDVFSSKPLGINDKGETIYDSVLYVSNKFEEEYFGISREYSNFSATLLIPDSSNYNAALNEMAANLGSDFNSYTDIPAKWQNEVLIPRLLHRGTYWGVMDPHQFQKSKLANIKGDSIPIDFVIDPSSRFICSNGIIYDYLSFAIPTSLYEENSLEGEALCTKVGDQFTWDEDKITLEGNSSFQPRKQVFEGASNDTVINVEFSKNYEETYAVSFKIKNVFPRTYRIVWKTNFRTSGIYSIYVNGEIITLGDPGFYPNSEELDVFDLSNGFYSTLGYKVWPDESGYLELDGRVDNITEYGDVDIKIEYRGSGNATVNGLNMDYVTLLPIEN